MTTKPLAGLRNDIETQILNPRRGTVMTVKCQAEVPGSGRWGYFHPHQCHKNAAVERDGVRYCGTHDPVKVEGRRDKKLAEEAGVRHAREERHKGERLEFIERIVTCKDRDQADKIIDSIVSAAYWRLRR